MPCWTSLLLIALLSGCQRVPEQDIISAARALAGVRGLELELSQHIELTGAMREALDHGIALRLVYDITACGTSRTRALWLRHAPLKRRYELQIEGRSEVRDFVRVSALEAALDRIRLPLDLPRDARCSGSVQVNLDLAALPTPLRFPAFFEPKQWVLRSMRASWEAP